MVLVHITANHLESANNLHKIDIIIYAFLILNTFSYLIHKLLLSIMAAIHPMSESTMCDTHPTKLPYNNAKIWLTIYDSINKRYVVVPRSFIIGNTETHKIFGQFISTLWFSERRTWKETLSYYIIISPRHITPAQIENHINGIVMLNQNEYTKYEFTLSLQTQRNLQKNDTIRVQCTPVYHDENNMYMSVHLRKLNDDEFYVSLPYIEF